MSELVDYISKDGAIYHFDSDDRFIYSIEGTGMPPIEYITQKGPNQHGETLIDYRLGSRLVQVVMRQDTKSRFDYWLQRHHLLNYMRPNRAATRTFGAGCLRHYLPDGSIRDLYAIINEGPVFSARNLDSWDEFGFSETLRFIAHDPIFYDPMRKSILWSVLIDDSALTDIEFPFEFPFTLGASAIALTKSITYLGTWLAYPTITITGPAEGFTIYNLSTAEKIELDYSIAVGEIVQISLPYGNKRVRNTDDDNLIGTVTEDSNLSTFHVAPDPEVSGGVNTFTIAATGTSSASRVLLEYSEGYIGI